VSDWVRLCAAPLFGRPTTMVGVESRRQRFGYYLRGRLTLRGRAWLSNPWTFGQEGCHLFVRYSC